MPNDNVEQLKIEYMNLEANWSEEGWQDWHNRATELRAADMNGYLDLAIWFHDRKQKKGGKERNEKTKKQEAQACKKDVEALKCLFSAKNLGGDRNE